MLNTKNLNKDDSSNNKENNNDILNTLNPKEKNIVTVDLSNDEKIVFSQLGINPLIKLGKEYLISNNFVRLKEKEETLDLKKTKTRQVKKLSKSKEVNEIEISIEENANSKVKKISKTNDNEEVLFLDKKDEIELTDDTTNTRKKRRRSSASIE